MDTSWLPVMDFETIPFVVHLNGFRNWILEQTFLPIILSICGLLLIHFLTWYAYQTKQLKVKLEKKRTQLKANIDSIRKRLNNSEINTELTEYDFKQLKQKLQQGELKPIDVLRAYQFKALQLYDSGNSGIGEFILEADQQALDLANHPNPSQLPLYGIPVSVKELCSIAGYDCTYGLVKRCNNPVIEDCTFIKVLKAQGAIPFVLTSTTQMAMGATGFNPIFGYSKHPLSDKHEPGGSSCGEAVLLTLKGSPIGFGTDAAGSIRIPASFCGLAGIKPTHQRISCQDMNTLHPDHICLLDGAIGPMGRKTEDLVEVCRALFQPPMYRLDQNIPPLPFNENLYAGLDKPKLRIGYYDTLDDPRLVQSVPCIRRAIHEAVEMLKAKGYEVVRFEPPDPHKAFLLALRLGYISGTGSLGKALFAEPSNWHTLFLKLGAHIPHWMRMMADYLSSYVVGKPASIMRTMSGPRNLKNCLKLLIKTRNYRNDFAHVWDHIAEIDALICPNAAFPAFPKSASSVYLLPSVVYVALYNMLDYPTGTVHVGHVDQQDVQEAAKLCQLPNSQVTRYQKNVLAMQTSSLGLPIGIQVVAKPYREELVLRIMSELERPVQDPNLR